VKVLPVPADAFIKMFCMGCTPCQLNPGKQ
jgi:hypothetical protein